MRRLAESLRSHPGGQSAALADQLEAEAARIILGHRPTGTPRDKMPHTDDYDRLCQLWRLKGIPSPTPVRPLYDLAVSEGIVESVLPDSVDGPNRLTAFSRWFAAFPHERKSRNGRLWHSLPQVLARAGVLERNLDPRVLARVQSEAVQKNTSCWAIIDDALSRRWGIDISGAPF
tara:strand:- start:89 stop:613 length:525 start_codon:yes stop_codon:yes gene_type:complete